MHHEKSLHHKKPKSHGGKKTEKNIAVVTDEKHRAWHLLFKNHTPDVIAAIINQTWLDSDYLFVVVPRK